MEHDLRQAINFTLFVFAMAATVVVVYQMVEWFNRKRK